MATRSPVFLGAIEQNFLNVRDVISAERRRAFSKLLRVIARNLEIFDAAYEEVEPFPIRGTN